MRTVEALSYTLKDDINKRNCISLSTVLAPTISAFGMPLLSREPINTLPSFALFFGKLTTIGAISYAHPGIFIPLALLSSIANICLRVEDESRRSIGEAPRIHDYNSLLAVPVMCFPLSALPRISEVGDNIKYVGAAILNSLWGVNATANRNNIIKYSLLTTAGLITVGVFYYTAMPAILSYMLPFITFPLRTAAVSSIPTFIQTLAGKFLPAVTSDYIARAIIWPLIPAIVSYFNYAYDIYNGHTALGTIKNTIGNANIARIPVNTTPQVEEAIKTICKRSGPVEQLIASAIILHDANIDLMTGAAGPHANKNLLEGPNGLCQAISNRNGALTNHLTNRFAAAVATAGSAANLINTINTDVTGVLTEQNDKSLIVNNQDKLDQNKLRSLVNNMALAIHAHPNCANIVNIDEVVKLVTLADMAVTQSMSR